ncbi:MAG: hypothetical protein D084_Lepto4C00329G0002 [Leptospirillum sp. Group IV 'UBA BS']|nr:MAG: hypothetical protein D084_Lepto4C00329G0002 [Leptospirillum sp. Group IV 'UBA BS']
MKALIHATAGTLAMITIAIFWVSTLISEVFLDHAAVAGVKQGIVHALFLLVPVMALTGGSGFSLGKRRKGTLVERKKTRMAIVAVNAFLVMIPAALFLNGKAASGEFDPTFYAVQVVELVAGVVQFTLMGLNFRDGLKLSGRFDKGVPAQFPSDTP